MVQINHKHGKPVIIFINNKIIQHQDPQRKPYPTTNTTKQIMHPSWTLLTISQNKFSLHSCKHNNNNTIRIVQCYVLNFTVLLMVV